MLASIFFNSIYALGIEAKFSGKVTDKIKKRVLDVVIKLKTSSLGREKLEKLKNDADTESIRGLLD